MDILVCLFIPIFVPEKLDLFAENMENRTIPTFDLSVFKDHPHLVDYYDEDFVIANTVTSMAQKDWTVRMAFLMMLECIEGQIQLNINGKPYLLHANEAVVCMPTNIVSQVMVSPYNRVRMVGFSTSFLRKTLKHEKEVEALFGYLFKNPLQQSKAHPLHINYYQRLIGYKMQQPRTKYLSETMRFLVSAMFCEMIEIAMKEVEHKGGDRFFAQANIPTPGIKRANLVFKQFMQELAQDNGMHRSVSYYADRLCYSPKYLSSVIRQVSGRTALDWINEYAVEQIKHQLKYSSRSIKEIAEEMRFSNQSFFGKYVKAHLGMSPAKYREQGK